MEDLTLALVTLTSFVLLFVVAIFADRAGSDLETPAPVELPTPTPDASLSVTPHADVA